MTELARDMVKEAFEGFYKDDRALLVKVQAKEDAVDELQDAITQYLVALTRTELSDEDSEKIPAFLHSVNDIERIGDHAMNIVDLAERKIDDKLKFSKEAKKEMNNMYQEVTMMMSDITKALPKKRKSVAKGVLDKEERLNIMTIDFRANHLERLRCKACSHISGIVFMDILMNLEKIGDHATNVAQAILGRLSWNNGSKEYNLKKANLE